MAQTNFTPILLYASSTPTNVPLAANLTNSATGSEIAINVADKNLFFKDSGGVVNTVPIRQSGTSSNGWLSSTDWNTFNGKAPATSGTSILYGNGSGGFSNVTIGTGVSFVGGTLSATGSGGTVTSVTGTSPVVSSGGTTPAISLATAYGDTLNPYASKTANYILAAPNGSAGVPTFRALVAADLPSLSGTYIPYTGASNAIDLNAQTVTNIAHLGINTTSVPTILIRAIGDNNSSSRIAMRGYSSNTSSSSIRVTKFRGTFAAPQAPQSGDSLGKFELAGYGTTSSDGYPQASYEGLATEAWGATARGTKVVFKVTPNTTITQAIALTLDQNSAATFASSVTATSFSGSGSSLTGVVTSVGATSPVTSSGGATPTIAMPAATTSVSGYLTSTDWNTFNNKGSGTVTSVTGTAPVVSSGGATPAISMAAATGSVNGYLTSTDWTTFNNKGSGTVTSVAALTLGTTGTDLSSTVATGTTTPVITLNVPTASATNRGALSAADWTTFNNKQPAGTYVTSVTGTAPVVSSGGTTPAISMAAATTSVNGYLTSTDWNTFNNKVSSQWVTSGSNINYTTGIVSVGTTGTESGFAFNVVGNAFVQNTSGQTIGKVVVDNADNRLVLGSYFEAGVGQYSFISSTNNAETGNIDLLFRTGTTERMRLFASGGVSIGNTTDPGAKNLSIDGYIRSNALATNWTFDTTNTGVTITNGNSITFANFSGMFLLTETAVYGNTAVYITGGGAIALISQSAGANYTATSAAGNIRFYWSAGVGYVLQNNSGSTLTFNICSFKNRTSN
jgi:hypothetical protein